MVVQEKRCLTKIESWDGIDPAMGKSPRQISLPVEIVNISCHSVWSELETRNRKTSIATVSGQTWDIKLPQAKGRSGRSKEGVCVQPYKHN